MMICRLVEVNYQRTGCSTNTDELGIRRRNGFGGTSAGDAGTGVCDNLECAGWTVL
jgi:hypothetical protein